MSEKTIETKIQEYDLLDEKTKLLELIRAKKDIEKDLKFAEFKKNYWTKLYSSLRQLRSKIVELQRISKDVCEICHQKEETEEMLRILPNGKRACKKCWKGEIQDTITLKFEKSLKSGP